MAKLKKSKFYDEFNTAKSSEQKTPRQIWSKIWRWLKIILIVIFVSVGLIGCVQSFVTKTSSKVGSGYEFYASKKQISPNIEVLRYNANTNAFEILNTDKFIAKNPFLGLNNKNNDLIEKLKKQDEQTGAVYGSYGGSSLALQLEVPTKTNAKKFEVLNGEIYNDGNKFTYINTSPGIARSKNYTPITHFTNIDSFYYLVHAQSTTDSDKYTFQRYDKLKSKEYRRIEGKLEGGSSVVEKFARDNLQILFNETFKQWFENNTGNIQWLLEPTIKTDEDHKAITDGSKIYSTPQINFKDPSVTFEQKMTRFNEFINIFNTATVSDKFETTTSIFQDDPTAPWKQPTFANLKNQEKEKELNKWNKYLWLKEASNFIAMLDVVFHKYTNYVNYKNSFTKDGKAIYIKSNLTKVGNVNNNAQIAYLLAPSGGTIPHKPLSTMSDYWKQGPFFGMFVQPINLMISKISTSLGTTGWSVILALTITVIIVRLIAFFISLKSAFGQSKLEEVNQKKAKIEAKYADLKHDKAAQQRKQVEISQLYKEAKISPFTALISSFVTLPILIVVFRIISAAPEIKQVSWYGIQFSASSISRVIAKDFIYLPFIIVSVGIQALAQYLPKLLNLKKNKNAFRTDVYAQQAAKKGNKTSNMIQILFIGMGAIFSTGLQIYWIIGGLWTIGERLFVHYFMKTRFYKEKIEPKIFPQTKTA
ncbi:membrane protein insertase YidC [Metamycoplasma hyosynoviae]|uniref:membrane protein insertase YidC n=1 Tax=Metamycoplasma hyosynoviae TaxID=29559 RepID=UPI00235999D0|nr:membrane protein insertase YidC [Metamycoplasma hyosynoviae]MDC8916472.1 membrane protein insertase YidC [Metamycoplasma hyosynoviae]MDD1360034.1 membrane protein insertase YidC [Metamycoplasma hyosynoviae]